MLSKYTVILGIFVIADRENFPCHLIREVLNGQIREQLVSWRIYRENRIPVQSSAPYGWCDYIAGICQSFRYDRENISRTALERSVSSGIIMKSIGILGDSATLEVHLDSMISRSYRRGRYVCYTETVQHTRDKRLKGPAIRQRSSCAHGIQRILCESCKTKASDSLRRTNSRDSGKGESERIRREIFGNPEGAGKSRSISFSILQTVYFPVSATGYEEGASRERETRRFGNAVFPPKKLPYPAGGSIVR